MRPRNPKFGFELTGWKAFAMMAMVPVCVVHTAIEITIWLVQQRGP